MADWPASGVTPAPARDPLKQALAGTKHALQYDLGFSADTPPTYLLTVSRVMREEDDGLGGKRLVYIDGRP